MVAVALALLLGAAPPAARADSGSAEAARFRQHVTAGERLYAGGDFGGAAWHFRRAEALRVTPEVAFNLAKAHERLADAALAAYYYRLYLRRAPGASDSLAVAETLGDLLSRAEANGRGLLEVEANAPGSLRIEGRDYPELPVAVFLPPGEYHLEAKLGGRTQERDVSLLTGKTTSVAFDVAAVTPPPTVAAPTEVLPAPVLTAEATPAPSKSSSRPTWHKASMGVLGASAVALIAGSVLGGMSRSAASRAQDKSALTVGEAQALADSANSRGSTANFLLLGGGVGALAGGVMFAFTLPEPGAGGGSR